jgi:hypothetical protein
MVISPLPHDLKQTSGACFNFYNRPGEHGQEKITVRSTGAKILFLKRDCHYVWTPDATLALPHLVDTKCIIVPTALFSDSTATPSAPSETRFAPNASLPEKMQHPPPKMHHRPLKVFQLYQKGVPATE